ncbi:MAG TPA: hypothetical protein DEF41_08805 [Desulfovibrio sp.]|uniref:Uncharacterized protein n=1 Tax=Nitratidesulfovibrio vulgaris (strain ATCC 29579 / DSM 644 / CCUG 34227 / NCIMB 8303 / VKM B-1760 / Hildenborough) TaxID=882 RepID=Q727V9_NITV2|nr:hypothetical protein DVU_2745 [Nitratidesulfovibrio vulgaris str. Hildenborough]HBW16214.1 hypothetical protein [Desulfovibrio sp.]
MHRNLGGGLSFHNCTEINILKNDCFVIQYAWN